MSTQTPDHDTILEIVRSWPPEDQMALVQDILQSQSPRRTKSGTDFLALAGIARVPGPVQPSAEEEAQWLEERRQRRSGE